MSEKGYTQEEEQDAKRLAENLSKLEEEDKRKISWVIYGMAIAQS